MQVVYWKGYFRGGVVVAALILAFAMMAPVAWGQSSTKCFGEGATIEGTNAPDVIIGTFGRDVIVTFAGNDTVRGEADFAGVPGGAPDLICLGDGNDIADGAAKADKVSGGPGDDILDGDNFPSPFGDTLVGGTGNDTFTGGQGNDTIQGDAGDDTIDNGSGTTVNQGADTVFGGSGDDLINEAADGSIDTINAGSGSNDKCIVDPPDRVSNCEVVIELPTG